MLRKIVIVSFLGLCLVGPTHAKTIDLRNMSDMSGQFEVSFCARPSPEKNLPGHMFVALSHVDAKGVRNFVSVGHTVGVEVSPKTAAWSYFGKSVPGRLNEENYTSIHQKCLAVKVNKPEYDRARALTANPLRQMGVSSSANVIEAYKLGEKDCISFLLSVANVLQPKGLTVPRRLPTDLPLRYAQKLISAN